VPELWTLGGIERFMNPWFLSVIALLGVGILEWVRRRKASRASSLVWRFLICLLLAGAVIPIRFTIDDATQTSPVIAMLLFDIGFDPKAALMDCLIIGGAAVVLCAIWSSVIFIRGSRR
jgi:hypothetical protein